MKGYLTWFRMVPHFDIMRHTIIILGPFNPLGAIVVKVTIQQHITEPEARDGHANVSYFNQHVEYDSYSHLEDRVNFVVEVVLDDGVCVDLIFVGWLQCEDFRVHDSENEVREVLEKCQTGDEERHPLKL